MKNSLIKVLSFVMALTMIVGCFSAITFSAAEHTHTKGDKVGEAVPATCAKTGYTLYECATCGVTYPDDVVPRSAEHTGVVDVPATEATCAYPAFTAGKTCTDCLKEGQYLEGYVPSVVTDSKPLGHKFVGAHRGNVCTLESYYVCADCGLTAEECYKIETADSFDESGYVAAVLATGRVLGAANIDDYFASFKGQAHVWAYEVKTAPETCKDGLTVATCETCGETNEIVIRAEHKFGTKTFNPCEEYVGIKCDLCGAPALTATVNENPAHAFNTKVTVMNSTLQGMGYTTVSQSATCYADGYEIYQCVCGEYTEVPVAKKAHNWSVWTAEGGEKPAVANAEVCVTAKTLTRKCAYCQLEESVTGVALKEHVFVSNVVDATCYAEGYTEMVCIYPGCHFNTAVRSNYTAKREHVYGDWEYVGSADDHSTDYKRVRTCKYEGCKAPAGVTDTTTQTEVIIAAKTAAATGETAKVVDGKTHFFVYDGYSDTVVAANCNTKAYYAYVCTVDGCGAVVPMNDTIEASKFNDELDKKVHNPATLTFLETVKKATCTATGTDKMICLNAGCNKAEVTVTTPAKGHAPESQWKNIVDKNGDSQADAGGDYRAVPVTCTSTGKTAGQVCPDCWTVVVPQQVIAIDPDAHFTKSGSTYTAVTGTVVTNQKATCSSVGYITRYFSCCKKYITEYPDGSDYANIAPSNHVWKEVKYKAVKCGVDGNHAYAECQECGKTEFITAEFKAANASAANFTVCACGAASHDNLPIEIVAAAHQFTIEHDAKAETCVAEGWTAHVECSVCHVTEGKVIIPAHGNAYAVEYADNTTNGSKINKPATHTETGIKAGKFCEKCDANETSTGYIIPKVAHTFVKTEVNYKSAQDYNCTLPTYDAYICACGASYADNYVKAAAADHSYEAAWHKFAIRTDDGSYNYYLDGKLYTTANFSGKNPITGKAVPASAIKACNPDAVLGEYRKCQLCEVADIKNVKAPINHRTTVNGAKVDILLDCQNIANFVGSACEICNMSISADAITHNATASYKDATCTENGYNLNVCIDCGEYLNEDNQLPTAAKPAINTVIPALGHKPYKASSATAEYVPANFVADTTGKHLFKIDENAVKYVVEEKAPTHGTDGYIKYMCAVCNEVVTFVIPFNSGVEFAISATPAFAGGKVEVTLAVSAKDYKFQTIKLSVAKSTALVLTGATLNYEFPVDDNVVLNTSDNGTFVTVLVYAPNDIATGAAKNSIISGEAAAFVTLTFDILPYANNSRFTLTVNEIKAVNDKAELVTKSDAVVNATALKDYAITLIGNANGDDYLDAADSVAIMAANYAGDYNAALDFDGNGAVDLDDHMAFIKFYTSKQMYGDYLKLLGVDYMDYVNNYDLRVDLDGDKVVTENDRNTIAIFLEEELNATRLANARDINAWIADIVEDLLNDGLRNGSNRI